MFRACLLAALLPIPAHAHFGLILPERAMVTQEDGEEVQTTFGFVHPFEYTGMMLETPADAFVMAGDTRTSLELSPIALLNSEGFTAGVPLERPGAYLIGMEPQPYWEPAEDAFIVHYTKTYVSAFGGDEGWDAMAGFPVEIRPLTRPVGLWEGNVFRGQVMQGDAPLAGVEVEVEFWNPNGQEAPGEIMITQTVVADDQGIFAYAPPGPGWWGFAALTTSDETMPHEGEEKAIELGGVIWVHFEPWD